MSRLTNVITCVNLFYDLHESASLGFGIELGFHFDCYNYLREGVQMRRPNIF